MGLHNGISMSIPSDVVASSASPLDTGDTERLDLIWYLSACSENYVGVSNSSCDQSAVVYPLISSRDLMSPKKISVIGIK